MAEIWTRATRQRQPTGAVAVSRAAGLSGAWLYSSSPAKEQIYDLVTGTRSTLQDTNNFLFPATYNGLLAGKNSNGSNVTALRYDSAPSPFAGASQLSMLAFFIFDPTSFASGQYVHWRQEFQHSIDVFSYTSSSITWGSDWAGAWNGASQQTLSGLSPGNLVCIGSSITQSGARLFHNGRFSGTKSGSSFGPLPSPGSVSVISGSRMPQLGGFAFRRALTDGEMVSYTANPWQLFAPERRVTYFFPASGIPTLSAATAVSITSTTATPRVTVTF
jgi:hypothetical protein